MICKNCNTQVSDGSRFCPNCGVQMSVNEPQSHSHGFCTECGAPLQEGLKFCIQCGAQVAKAPLQPVEPQQPMAQAEQPQSVQAASQSQPTVGIVMPPEPPTDNEKKKHSKKFLWWLIPLILVVVGGIVALILLTRSGSSRTTYSWDEEYGTFDDTIGCDVDSVAWLAEEDEAEPVDGDIKLTGYWQSTEVELSFHFTVYPDGSVKATGKAVYKPDDRVLTYSLQGSGHDYDSYSDIDFHEYNSAGDYTGRWSGRFEFENPNYTYSGTFYDEEDDSYCDFNLSGTI